MYVSESALTTAGVSSLYVATGLRAASSALDMFNGTTFLYDPYWVYNKNMATLPLAFIRSTEITEDRQATIAKKRIILYSSSEDTTNAKQSVVAMNRVNDPVTYRVTGIMPAAGLDTFFTPIQKTVEALAESFETHAFGDKESSLKSVVQWGNYTVNTIAEIVGAVMDILASMSATTEISTYTKATLTTLLSASGISGSFFNSLNTPYNKNSLTQMFDSNHIVTFKNWENWKYKYGVMSNLNVTKKGEDGAYYQVSFNLQEIPVMVVKPSKDVTVTKSAWYAAIQKKIYGYAKTAVNTLGDVNL